MFIINGNEKKTNASQDLIHKKSEYDDYFLRFQERALIEFSFYLLLCAKKSKTLKVLMKVFIDFPTV